MYRQVPNEDHMCLLVYSDLLPRLLHDEIMQGLESLPGQQAENLAEALFRIIMADGRNLLEVIHREGFMKKVNTNQVIMTPTTAASIRLDELNSILNEMATGQDAINRMAELDRQSGMSAKTRASEKPHLPAQPAPPTLQAPENGVLTDEMIANNQRAQAIKMRAEAKALLAEAESLDAEAEVLIPSKPTKAAAKPATKPATRAAKAPVVNTKEIKKNASTKKAASGKI